MIFKHKHNLTCVDVIVFCIFANKYLKIRINSE